MPLKDIIAQHQLSDLGMNSGSIEHLGRRWESTTEYSPETTEGQRICQGGVYLKRENKEARSYTDAGSARSNAGRVNKTQARDALTDINKTNIKCLISSRTVFLPTELSS